MRPSLGTMFINAGAAVGVLGVVVYFAGIPVHLSPALVSLLLAKAAFAAAGGLMITGAVLRRRALQRSEEERSALAESSQGTLDAQEGSHRSLPLPAPSATPGDNTR
ncbi:MAG: hypothetical protein M3081_22145 [Gemmatimonadota bacterium]|nr:hypothetical protein [Gemmatimonadota bacterium]